MLRLLPALDGRYVRTVPAVLGCLILCSNSLRKDFPKSIKMLHSSTIVDVPALRVS